MATNNLIVTTGDKALPFLSKKNDVTSLVNPDTLKNLKSSPNLTTYFGKEVSLDQNMVAINSNPILRDLYNEKKALIEEEANLNLEFNEKGERLVTPPQIKYKTEIISNYLITTPLTIVDKSIAVFFGGCCWANLERMKNYIPESILNNKRVIIIDESKKVAGKSITVTYEETMEFVGKKFPKEKISSVSGFSKGGKQAWKAASENEIGKYNYINLIDPEMYKAESNYAKSDPKILMIYNPEVWTDCCPLVKQTQIETGPKMGTSSIKVSLSHSEIPTYFFNRHSSRF